MMCKTARDYLGVLREYTKEVFTFGGFILAVLIYNDFKNVVTQTARTNAQTVEVLHSIDARISHLEKCHDVTPVR